MQIRVFLYLILIFFSYVSRHYVNILSIRLKFFISRHVFKTRATSARALLAFPVTYSPIRNGSKKYKQTTALDKSGHGCGRFNEIKANRIITHGYM